MGNVTNLRTRTPYQRARDYPPCDMELREPTEWPNVSPRPTSFQIEQKRARKYRWMRRLTTTGFVVLCGMLVSIYLWGQVR